VGKLLEKLSVEIYEIDLNDDGETLKAWTLMKCGEIN
jgi:hypothetical protein